MGRRVRWAGEVGRWGAERRRELLRREGASGTGEENRLNGGEPAAVVTRNLIGVFLPRPDACVYERLATLYADCEIVIVEGDIEAPGVKIEVWRAAAGSTCLAAERSDIVAVVSDDGPLVRVPVWPRQDIIRLADHVWMLARKPAQTGE